MMSSGARLPFTCFMGVNTTGEGRGGSDGGDFEGSGAKGAMAEGPRHVPSATVSIGVALPCHHAWTPRRWGSNEIFRRALATSLSTVTCSWTATSWCRSR